jgi:hypothetical protein
MSEFPFGETEVVWHGQVGTLQSKSEGSVVVDFCADDKCDCEKYGGRLVDSGRDLVDTVRTEEKRIWENQVKARSRLVDTIRTLRTPTLRSGR